MNVKFSLINVNDILGRLIRNPYYGGPALSLHGWTWRPEISKHGKQGFQDALVQSIREHGVRNPVLVWSLPEGMFLTFGGSRVRAAKEAGIERIPAIINDYTGDYEAADTVTPENYTMFFMDPPKEVEFNEDGFDYHYNLERARRHNHDPAGFAWLEGEQPDWIAQEFPWLTEE